MRFKINGRDRNWVEVTNENDDADHVSLVIFETVGPDCGEVETCKVTLHRRAAGRLATHLLTLPGGTSEPAAPGDSP
jgi:hypothetical protein